MQLHFLRGAARQKYLCRLLLLVTKYQYKIISCSSWPQQQWLGCVSQTSVEGFNPVPWADRTRRLAEETFCWYCWWCLHLPSANPSMDLTRLQLCARTDEPVQAMWSPQTPESFQIWPHRWKSGPPKPLYRVLKKPRESVSSQSGMESRI